MPRPANNRNNERMVALVPIAALYSLQLPEHLQNVPWKIALHKIPVNHIIVKVHLKINELPPKCIWTNVMFPVLLNGQSARFIQIDGPSEYGECSKNIKNCIKTGKNGVILTAFSFC